MKLKYTLCFQPVGDMTLGVIVGEGASSVGKMLQLNDVGAFIVKLMQEDVTVDQIVDKILDEYETDRETALESVNKIVDYLKAEDVLDV